MRHKFIHAENLYQKTVRIDADNCLRCFFTEKHSFDKDLFLRTLGKLSVLTGNCFHTSYVNSGAYIFDSLTNKNKNIWCEYDLKTSEIRYFGYVFVIEHKDGEYKYILKYMLENGYISQKIEVCKNNNDYMFEFTSTFPRVAAHYLHFIGNVIIVNNYDLSSIDLYDLQGNRLYSDMKLWWDAENEIPLPDNVIALQNHESEYAMFDTESCKFITDFRNSEKIKELADIAKKYIRNKWYKGV